MIHHKLKLQTLFFFLLFLSVIGVNDNDSGYMLELLEAITPTPPGWSNNTDICTWTGVVCLYGTDRVYITTINLNSLSLSGTFPSVLNSLNSLTYLSLYNNSFTGPLPSLANLTSLTHLSLSNNSFTGPLPSLANLNSLTYVDLSRNNFTSIPPDCFQGLTGLHILYMSYNVNLEPWTFPNLTHSWQLQSLDLGDTNIMGSLPDIFDSFPNLDNLVVSNNNITGVLPKSFARSQISKLWLNDQHLGMSGTLDVLSSMAKLHDVQLQGNQFTGSIPGNVLLRPYPDSARRNKTSMSTVWIAGIFGVAGVIVILIVIVYNHKRCLNLVQKIMFKKTRTLIDHSIEDFIRSYGSLTPKRYSFSEIKRITNSFHDKLGQGGYGVVYKASLTDGCLVAVKVLNDSKGSGEEFINEVASISRTSHVNIVSLLGFCYEVNKRALIYEYMPHGSLDKFIYKNGSTNAICNLNWNTLYQIAIGIARGLEYLHRGCSTRILHLDIKPQNILLDEDFCPKISDFGLAKICQKKESVVSLLGTRGTIGYIAPEVFSRTYGGVSHKSDVYSYGMLILEMVGGKKNYNSVGSHTSEMYFPDWIYKDIEQDNFGRCLANTVEENDIVMKITLVSLWCIQPNPLERPSMSKVLEMLEGPLQSVPYPPKPILYSPEMSSLSFSDVSYSNIHETN